MALETLVEADSIVPEARAAALASASISIAERAMLRKANPATRAGFTDAT
jgi:hypothetical protein